MVMQNRHDGANSPSWWDDLPLPVKQRVPQPASNLPANRTSDCAEDTPEPTRSTIVADLSRLAILFCVVSLVNVIFLLLALSFLFGSGPLAV